VYFLYSLLFGAILLAALPIYLIKLKLIRKQSLRIRERLGFRIPKPDSNRPFVWIHAVSVGEVLSVQRLVKEIKTGHPDWQIGFSVLTETGHKMAAAKLDSIDLLFFVPFDIGWAVRRYFKELRPRLLVLAESEFWPRLLGEARRSDCPVLLVNGRISDRTYRRFLRWRWAARRLFENINQFLVRKSEVRNAPAGA
jgi:3-deoxy-D-manno-octulosonic-acid transferase